MKHWLILGAGASLGARHDWPNPPPVGDGLAPYLLKWLEANNYTGEQGVQAQIKGFSHNWQHPPKWLFEEPRYKLARAFLQEAQRGGFEATVKAYLADDRALMDGINQRFRDSGGDWALNLRELDSHHQKSPKDAVVYAAVDVLACSIRGWRCSIAPEPRRDSGGALRGAVGSWSDG